MSKKTTPPPPIIPYTVLVGRVILQKRSAAGLHQSDLAAALQISQSAYSRIEQGDTTLSISQLRKLTRRLGIGSGQMLQEADRLAEQLRLQGVAVSDEKEVSTASALIGLGILAAILAAAR